MRVLHLIESLEFGGAEKVLIHLANRMSARHQVSVCTTKRRGELEGELEPRIDLIHLEFGEGNNPGLPVAIRKLLRVKRIDILHIHDWGVFVEGVVATLGTSTRIVQTVHGPYIQYAPGYLSRAKKALRHTVERLLSPRVSRIIPVSEDIRKYVIGEIGVPASKVEIIHNGIADIGEAASDRRETGGKVAFITTGRLAAIKNHRMMLEAFALVYREHPGISLSIVGDGDQLASLRALCDSLGIAEAVRFPGFSSDVPGLLAQHDVFLLSSRYEGVSIALLEAMCLSMPAIVTDVGGLPEMVADGDSGFVVPSDSPEAFAAAMKQLVTGDSLIDTLGARARQRYLDEFSEEIVISKYNAVYEECARNA
ncbi:MAG: glycosyltransferase family 4 protein [Gammaproteobacteria bacterium]|jgi:glycosyltransferase involved in cell wall biosynthesis